MGLSVNPNPLRLRPHMNKGSDQVCYLASANVTLTADQFLSGKVIFGDATAGAGTITLPSLAALITARPNLANTNAIVQCDFDILTCNAATTLTVDSETASIAFVGVGTTILNLSVTATTSNNQFRVVVQMASASTATAYVLPNLLTSA